VSSSAVWESKRGLIGSPREVSVKTGGEGRINKGKRRKGFISVFSCQKVGEKRVFLDKLEEKWSRGVVDKKGSN